MSTDWVDAPEGTTAYRNLVVGRPSAHRWGTPAHIDELLREVTSLVGDDIVHGLLEVEHRSLAQGDRRPVDRHRLAKIMVKLSAESERLKATGGVMPSFDKRGSTMLTELARYSKVLDAWKDHPWFNNFCRDLASPAQFPHDIGLLSLVSSMQRTGLAVRFIATGTKPLPDLTVTSSQGVEAPVEVKAPLSLQRPDQSACVTIDTGRRAVAKAWKKARSQLDVQGHGILAILSQGLCRVCTENVVRGIMSEMDAGLGARRPNMPGLALFREHEIHIIQRIPDSIVPTGWHAKHHHRTLSEWHFVHNVTYEGPVIFRQYGPDRVMTMLGRGQPGDPPERHRHATGGF